MKSAFVVIRAPVPTLQVLSHRPSAHLHTGSSAAPSSGFLSSLWSHSLSSLCIYSVLTWCPLHTHLAPTLNPLCTHFVPYSVPTPHSLRTHSTPLCMHSALHMHSAPTPHALRTHSILPFLLSVLAIKIKIQENKIQLLLWL